MEQRNYFYPRSPCGERLIEEPITFNPPEFLSTLSLRRATADCPSITVLHCNFYPRSPCGERRCARCHCWGLNEISIHALLAESDQYHIFEDTSGATFLSTLSLRRATHLLISNDTSRKNFYPRSPCGERHGRVNLFGFQGIISIHALLAESDIRTCQYFFSNF